MAEWYYQAQGELIGPVSFEALQDQADRGKIEEQTLVREGAEGPWIAASQVPGLLVEPSGGGTLRSDEEPAGETPGGLAPSAVETVPDHAHEIRRSPLNLRPCPDCGTMVSQKASLCPHCGRSFQESSLTIPYEGEHPIPVWVFFIVLAVVFILGSPVLVQRAALKFASVTIEDPVAANGVALLVAACYAISMVSCAVLGGAVGAPRMAYYTGLLLGLFFGPLGVFAAFAIDKRPQCPNCFSRLGGLARECPSCKAHLTWAMELRWY